jgi:CubicO group peptidase (beta-lactamase class C family)
MVTDTAHENEIALSGLRIQFGRVRGLPWIAPKGLQRGTDDMTLYSRLTRFNSGVVLLPVFTFLLLALASRNLLAVDVITPDHFADAARYSFSHGGLTLRVEQGGRLIFEEYARGFSASTSHRIFSGTKSFVAVGALIAQQEGLLSLDEKASDTLTEWQGDRRRSITINQLLSHTSGLDPDGDLIYPYRDQFAAAVQVRLIDPPGTRFHYGAVNYEVFGEILRRKLAARRLGSVEDFLKEKVFDPLDIDITDWKHDDAGNPLTHSGIWLSTEEWAKFGNFINKVRNGATGQIITAPGLATLLTGHHANPAYGLGFWLNRPPPEPSTATSSTPAARAT